MEAWKPVCGWEDYYEVSNLGRVRRRANSPCRYKTEKILSPKVLKRDKGRGYLQVTLKNDRVGAQTLYVHRLVCEAFHGPAQNSKLCCCHNDGDNHNNRSDNLRWDTRALNEADRIKHGTSNRGERHGLSKLTMAEVLTIKSMIGVPHKEIATRFGITQHTVSDIRAGRRWKHA